MTYFKIVSRPVPVVAPSPAWDNVDSVKRYGLAPVSASELRGVSPAMAMEFSEEDMTGIIRVWLQRVDFFIDSAGARWELGSDRDDISDREYIRTAPGEAMELWTVSRIATVFAARDEIHAAYRVRAMAEAAFARASERFAKDPTIYNGRVSKRARKMADDAHERLADYGVEGWA